jgi:chemotaxis protein MotD
MMDQLINSLNNGAPVENREPSKPRNDKQTTDKGGFGDTLSSVKSNSSSGNYDEDDHGVDDTNEASNDDTAHVDEAEVLRRKRRAQLQAKEAQQQNAANELSGKDGAAKNDAKMPDALRDLATVTGDEATAILKEAVGLEGRVNDNNGQEGAAAGVDNDAAAPTVADIVSSLLASADGAANALAAGGLEGMPDTRKDDRVTDRLAAKNDALAAKSKGEQQLDPLGKDAAEFPTDGEANYRFNLARGEGLRSLDMSVRGQDGRIDFDVKDAGGRITENVTVLESRRFLGLATPTNATSMAGLIASDSEWMNALRPENALLNSAAQSSAGKVVHSLKLHLTPHDLGSVTMSLRMVGEELQVHMTVENMNAYRRLQEDNRSMMDALKAHGITVDQISISVSAAEKGDQTQGQNNGQSGNNQQLNAGSENGKGTGARNRQDQSDEAGAQHEQQMADANSDSDPRSGSVYL